ncbi:hypothetical protein J0L40_00720 [Stenotrophomonas maltophilia]|nr:hypothetical protein [Stenotrophomonas maltophilia]
MAIESILDTARAGMSQERLRLEAASRNIASANTALPVGVEAQRWQMTVGKDFSAQLQAVPTPAREVSDPGHPLADTEGFVRYARVDMAQEMTTLMTASRGYEANVRSFNLLRGMTLRALDIGAK